VITTKMLLVISTLQKLVEIRQQLFELSSHRKTHTGKT